MKNSPSPMARITRRRNSSMAPSSHCLEQYRSLYDRARDLASRGSESLRARGGQTMQPMRHLRRPICILSLALILFPQLIASQTQTSAQSPSANPNSAGNRQTNQAKPKCVDNGTYVNSQGQTVKRPETCSSVPDGATAQCRDRSYSFSKSRRGTCSHHGGVSKWF
jgi:hypothetical protein